MVSAESTVLEHGVSSLVRSDTSGECLVMAGYKNDRFSRFVGVDENIDDSTHDLFVLLVVSECIALISILNTLVII